jgi:hypothetical protein
MSALSQRDVAARLGISRSRVRQLEQRALRKYELMQRAQTSTLEIASCSQCPCRTELGCEYPGREPRTVPEHGVPEWCPLLSAPLVTVLRVAHTDERNARRRARRNRR